jgi:ribonuclease Y
MLQDTRKLREEIDRELLAYKAKKLRALEEELKLEAQEKAREILVDAMMHGATSIVPEYTISTVVVPNDEVKGRIIGREGRNIRAFEQATGVEIELDETNEIRLSSFDPIRREIAKRSLEKLIKDGRIQPSRIVETVNQERERMDEVLLEEGKNIAYECGVYDLPVDIIQHIGRYKFRTSYGQNLAQHTIEDVKIAVQIAAEIGANEEIVRKGALLHDIGKVITNEEGNHVQLGVNFLKRYGLPQEVLAAVAEHHQDRPFSSIESVIVYIADAISGSRPGARYEPHEDYVERMEKIEEIARQRPGVEQAFAFQAGREVQVIVNPKEVSDDDLKVLAYDIARKLEQEVEYAGQIKVNVIRQTQASQTTAAK